MRLDNPIGASKSVAWAERGDLHRAKQLLKHTARGIHLSKSPTKSEQIMLSSVMSILEVVLLYKSFMKLVSQALCFYFPASNQTCALRKAFHEVGASWSLSSIWVLWHLSSHWPIILNWGINRGRDPVPALAALKNFVGALHFWRLYTPSVKLYW